MIKRTHILLNHSTRQCFQLLLTSWCSEHGIICTESWGKLMRHLMARRDWLRVLASLGPPPLPWRLRGEPLLWPTCNHLRSLGVFSSVHFNSVAQSCLTLCDPVNRSTPGLPVHHQLLEFTQTHVHGVSDAIQPSHPLLSPSPPAPNPSQHQGLFQWVNSSHEVAQ